MAEAEIKEMEEGILQRTVALRNTLEQVDTRETATLEREKLLEAQWARLQEYDAVTEAID